MEQNKDSGKIVHSRRHAGIFVALCIFAVVAIVGLWQRQAIANQLDDWKLLPRPERLTELYFARHDRLPADYTPGEAHTVSFTLHNLEGRPQTYRYQIVQQPEAGQPIILYEAESTLSDGESKTISEPVVLQDTGQRSAVIVRLADRSETIHYWMQRAE